MRSSIGAIVDWMRFEPQANRSAWPREWSTELPPDGRPDGNWVWRIVQALTLVHAFLFVLFLATLASAAPATSTPCGGANLIEELDREAPERLASLRAQAAASANGQGVFWRIDRVGLAPSHLLGTMHSPDSRIARLDSGIAAALASSTTVLVENARAFDREAMREAMASLRRLTSLAEGRTLDRLIGAEHLAALQSAAEAHGLPWTVARLLLPWMVAAAIAMPVCDSEAKANGAPVLDQLVIERARDAGKPLINLETIEEQFAAVAGLPEEFHVSAIVDLLALGARVDDLIETTKQLYLSGDTGMLLPLARAYSPRANAGPGYEQFTQRLIVARNRRMAQRALPELAKGGVFIAVGALHLPSDNGLIELLRRQGYSVERVGRPLPSESL